jgi:hypothetical protein
MKTKPKKTVRDPLVRQVLTQLKKKHPKCGYGDQMEQVRRMK